MPSIAAALGTASNSGSSSKMLLSNCFTSFKLKSVFLGRGNVAASKEWCGCRISDQLPPSDCHDDGRCYPAPCHGLATRRHFVGMILHGLNVC
jgi:hypothetical protein